VGFGLTVNKAIAGWLISNENYAGKKAMRPAKCTVVSLAGVTGKINTCCQLSVKPSNLASSTFECIFFQSVSAQNSEYKMPAICKKS